MPKKKKKQQLRKEENTFSEHRMAAKGTRSLVFIRMNSEVYRAILCAPIQPNAAKLME